MNACDVINTRLAPIKAANPTVSFLLVEFVLFYTLITHRLTSNVPTQANWPTLVAKASAANIDLLAEGWYSPLSNPAGGPVFQYYVYAAAASVVEIDVLTGELEVRACTRTAFISSL